jgi:hypothetical protein
MRYFGQSWVVFWIGLTIVFWILGLTIVVFGIIVQLKWPNLYLLIKEVMFLPLFFVRFFIAYIFLLKLQTLPPFSEWNGSSGRILPSLIMGVGRYGRMCLSCQRYWYWATSNRKRYWGMLCHAYPYGPRDRQVAFLRIKPRIVQRLGDTSPLYNFEELTVKLTHILLTFNSPTSLVYTASFQIIYVSEVSWKQVAKK